jgi:hypothetical protein
LARLEKENSRCDPQTANKVIEAAVLCHQRRSGVQDRPVAALGPAAIPGRLSCADSTSCGRSRPRCPPAGKLSNLASRRAVGAPTEYWRSTWTSVTWTTLKGERRPEAGTPVPAALPRRGGGRSSACRRTGGYGQRPKILAQNSVAVVDVGTMRRSEWAMMGAWAPRAPAQTSGCWIWARVSPLAPAASLSEIAAHADGGADLDETPRKGVVAQVCH